MQLGDGGEVIEIEPPAGDFARRMGPPFVGGESAVPQPQPQQEERCARP